MKDYIHLTVAAIIEHDQQFLMVEEYSKKLKKNVINQPAGHVENNEPILDAIVRETLEETAYMVKPEKIIGIYQSFIDENNDNTQYLRVCYACSLIMKTDNALDPDIVRALWLNKEEILSLSNARSPMVKQCLSDYLAGKSFPLEFITALR